MAPRKYRLGKRAVSVAETRQRIIDAAVALYQEQGISFTTMQDVARRADVAPGTVFNHFATPDDLAETVVEFLITDLRAPSEDMLDGLDTVQERVSRLAHDLAAFYQRSEPWYRVYQREGGKAKAFVEGEIQFNELLDRLMRKSLGPLAADGRVVAALKAVVNPGVFGMLQAQGMSSSGAADLVVEMLTPWLGRKADERSAI